MVERIVLASASPRRAQLIAMLGIVFETDVSAVDEDLNGPHDAEERARALALDKARAVAARHPQRIVLAADTLIDFDGRLLGKPNDAAGAVVMLQSLRARWHRVITGLAVIDGRSGQEIAAAEVTRVLMRDYTDAEIAAYVDSGDPMDKAAAYAIQNRAFHPVAQIDVCYTNVMGLPLCATRELLARAGLSAPREGSDLRSGTCSFCRQAQ